MPATKDLIQAKKEEIAQAEREVASTPALLAAKNRKLDRAHTAEVGRVHVAHLHGGAVAGQTAGAQCGKTTLVRHTGQRVVPDICPREKEFAGMMKQLRDDLVRVAHGDLSTVPAKVSPCIIVS